MADPVPQLKVRQAPQMALPVEPTPVPSPAPVPWYMDRSFIASICAMLTALFAALGAWLSQSNSVDAKKQSQQNAAQIQDVHKDVKHNAKAMGIPPRAE